MPRKSQKQRRRLTNKNVKQVYEELDDVDELLQDVLNIRSSATNEYALSCKHFLPRPRASDSAIVYEYVTHACMCVDKRHDMAQGWRSLVFNKLRLNAPSPYALLFRMYSSHVIVISAIVSYPNSIMLLQEIMLGISM